MLKAEAIGRLVADPELRYTPSGKAVCTFRLACDVGPDDTEFITVIGWEKLAETLANNLQKGRLVYAEGRLQIRTYEKQDGGKGQATELVLQGPNACRFLDYKKQEKEQAPPPPEPTAAGKRG